MNIVNTLQQLFPKFSTAFLNEIEKHAVVKQYDAGVNLIKTGQFITSTALVLEGNIKIYREDEEGGEFLMYYLQPGQACALSMMCISQYKKSEIWAKVVQPSTILHIPVTVIADWVKQYSEWNEFVIETYRNRFNEVLQVVDSIAFKAMDERLQYYLTKQQQAYNSKQLHISHQEIADDLNTSREVISRLLKKMEQQQLIVLHRNMIEIL